MKATYRLTRRLTYYEGTGICKMYGVAMTSGGKTKHVKDISHDKKSVEAIVELFNRCEIDSEHFDIAIEDAMLSLPEEKVHKHD